MRLDKNLRHFVLLALTLACAASSGCDKAPQEDPAPSAEATEATQLEQAEDRKNNGNKDGDTASVEAAAAWNQCTDGAKRAFACEFADGGGATVCVKTKSFAELRLDAPDASPAVYRHRLDAHNPTVRFCDYTSPHRTWQAAAFFEQDRAVAVSSEHLSGEFAGSDSDETDHSVAVLFDDRDNVTFECEKVDEDNLFLLQQDGVDIIGQDTAGCGAVAANPPARRGQRE